MSRYEDQRAPITPSLEDPATCAAQDLKVILYSIADQIADCDRRHLSVLNEIQDRLVDFGKGTAEVKAHLPEEVIPAVSRVEDRITQLAGLLADADKDERRAREDKRPAEQYGAFSAMPLDKMAKPDAKTPAREHEDGGPLHFGGWHAEPSLAPFGGHGPEPAWEPASENFASHLTPAGHESPERTMSGPTPAPLKSAAGAESLGAFTHRADAGLDATRGPVDTFDVIGSSEAVPGEQPWDRHAAEALVELYETGHVHFGRSLSDDLSGEPGPAASGLSSPSTALATVTPEDPQRAWLETRFAEIADKLEQSLAEMRPDHSLEELGARFERLEDRLGTALADAATRADVAGLKSIERHIDDLSAQLEAAQSQFARLDGIEEEIRALAERVSDARVTELLGNASPQDVDAVAKAVADRLGTYLPGFPVAEAGNAGRFDELRGLLQSFIDEKRKDEHRTDTMLDTMQQAMMRLLDRMDALEGGEHLLADEPAENLAEIERLAEIIPMPRPELDEPRVAPAASYDFRAPEASIAAAPEVSPPQDYVATPSPVVEELVPPKMDDAPPSEPVTVTLPVGMNAPVEPPRSREEFIAAARKAARQASAQATAAAELARAKSGASGLGMGLGMGLSLAKTAGRSRLMVAIIALLAVGAGFTVVKAIRGSGNSSTIDHQMQDPDGKQSLLDGSRERPELDKAASTRRALLDPAVPLEQLDALAASRHGGTTSMRTGAQGTETGSLPASPGGTPEISDAGVSKSAANRGSGEMPPVLIGPLSLRLAASKGDPSAEFEVGSRFAEGKGIQQDLKRAIVWYQRSAMQGFASAQFRLATHYERGLGVKTDLAQARNWYQRAAEQGHVKAMHNLAVLGASREQGSPDYAAAARWFAMAADHGLTDSQYNLAILLENGLGVGRDAKQAYKWYTLAARAGDTEAARRRDLLKARLTSAEQREIEGQIDGWRAKATDQALNDARAAGEAWKMRASEARAQ